MEEFWMPIKGYEGIYEVSSIGRIKSLKREIKNNNGVQKLITKLLCPTRASNGYRVVNLRKNKSTKQFYIHRLILDAFLELSYKACTNKRCTNHKNGNKLDNRISNLERASHSDNIIHAYATGLRKVTAKQIEAGRKVGKRKRG